MEYSDVSLKKQLIITIGREYGSGGRTSGKLLAEKLGINYYDDEILKMASEESAINEEIFRMADEMPGKNILRLITNKIKLKYNFKTSRDITSPDSLYEFQSSVIRELAEKDNFVILGRCANYVLENQHKDKVLRVFLYADFDTRVERIMQQEKIEKNDAILKIKKKDKKRNDFYKYFTGVDIYFPSKYDIMINTSTIGFDEVINILLGFLQARGYLNTK